MEGIGVINQWFVTDRSRYNLIDTTSVILVNIAIHVARPSVRVVEMHPPTASVVEHAAYASLDTANKFVVVVFDNKRSALTVGRVIVILESMGIRKVGTPWLDQIDDVPIIKAHYHPHTLV